MWNPPTPVNNPDADKLHTVVDGRTPEEIHKAYEDAEEAHFQAWRMGVYVNDENGCENCGRMRVCLCNNGKRRCEKCNWCPELKGYAPVNDHGY